MFCVLSDDSERRVSLASSQHSSFCHSSEENVRRRVTVRDQRCALVRRRYFLWLSSLKVSLGICHSQSEKEHFATGNCHPALVAHCHLEFLHDVHRAKAVDAIRAPGAIRQIGSREECETLGRGKQLDIWKLLLPLCYEQQVCKHVS